MKFEFHTLEGAPKAVQTDLSDAQKRFGAIPNLYRGLATNPAALKVYLHISEMLMTHGQLSPVEQQVVYLAVSAENSCSYCVTAHSALAGMANMPEQTLTELRSRQSLSDAKLDALRNFTLSVMQHRGYVPEQNLADFQDAGYDQRHILEVLTILAHKTLSNYFNHMANTPVDDMFASQKWNPEI